MSYKEALQLNKGKNWYSNDHNWIKANYSEPDLFAGLLAATSPRVSVKRSLSLANRIYDQFMAGNSIDFTGMMPSTISNIKRAIAGLPLSGNKVKAFYENLIGNYQAVTIDTWMLKFFKLPAKSLTDRLYNKLVKRVQRHARRLKIAPAELQAVLWVYIRTQYSETNVSYSIVAERESKQMMLF